MHYEKASAELITFVNGCFIMTGNGSGTSSDDSSEESGKKMDLVDTTLPPVTVVDGSIRLLANVHTLYDAEIA